MKVYMVRDKKTGTWYKCGQNGGSWWTGPQKAAAWTTLAGPRGAVTNIERFNYVRARCSPGPSQPEPEIVTLTASENPRVTFVDADDWEGLYIDGKLVDQGHHIHLDKLFTHLGIDGQYRIADNPWLSERGTLPDNLDEVKFDP